MKKVGILTMHAAHNCGTSLQAYALKRVITNLGYDCHFINFQSDVQIKQYSFFNTKNMNIKILARNILNLLYASSFRRRRESFFNFINEYLDGKSPRLPDIAAVEQAVKNYDYVVVGSDQVWNLTLNDASKAFFLNFPKHEKRISYAASFGSGLTYLNAHDKEILPMIKTFDCISIREEDGVEFLKRHGVASSMVLDPTLLLNLLDWDEITSSPLIKKPYILYYSLNCKPFSMKTVKKIAKQLKLPVINPTLHTRAIGSGLHGLFDCGPMQFLSLVKNASFVCTDSFHGTTFSIIMGKPFVSIFDDHDGHLVRENRKASLLEQLGLENRMVTPKTDLSALLNERIDYPNAYKKLKILREESLDFLKKSLKRE